jgi:hypothetical protein
MYFTHTYLSSSLKVGLVNRCVGCSRNLQNIEKGIYVLIVLAMPQLPKGNVRVNVWNVNNVLLQEKP